MNRLRLYLFLGICLLVALLLPPLLQGDAGYFWSGDNGRFLAAQTGWLAFGALGMMLIVTSGGVDLSAAAIATLAGSATAAWMAQGGSPGVALLIGFGTGLGAGGLNGLLISITRLPAILLTLAAAGVYAGWASSWSLQKAPPESWLGNLSAPFPSPGWILLAPAFWLALLLAAGMSCLLRFTVFGVHLMAIGSHEQAARLCGVPVGWRRTVAYALAGGLFALMGVMQIDRLGTTPTVSPALLPDLITAALIGSLATSGPTRVWMTLLGAALITLLHNASQQASWPPWSAPALTLLLLIATLDCLRQRGKSLSV